MLNLRRQLLDIKFEINLSHLHFMTSSYSCMDIICDSLNTTNYHKPDHACNMYTCCVYEPVYLNIIISYQYSHTYVYMFIIIQSIQFNVGLVMKHMYMIR